MANAVSLRSRIEQRKNVQAPRSGAVHCLTEAGEWAVAKAVKVNKDRCKDADALAVYDTEHDAKEGAIDVNKAMVGQRYLKRAGGNVRKALGNFCRDSAIRKSSLNTVSGAAGGYLVPVELLVDVSNILTDTEIFHRFAFCTPMAAMTTYIPAYDINASHVLGASPLFGGLSLQWKAEGSTVPDALPSYEQSELVAKNLYGLVTTSDQLVADGGEPFGVFMNAMLAKAIVWSVERACFQGGLANQPQGVINSPASVIVNRNSAGDVKSLDLATMSASLLPACYNNAIWVFHPSVVTKISQLSQWQISEPTEGRLIGILEGRPAYCSEKLSTLGTKGDIVLFDPTQYALGTRQIEIAWAPSIDTSLVTSRQTLIRVIWRGDGKFMAKGTATLQDNSTVCGVSVVLN